VVIQFCVCTWSRRPSLLVAAPRSSNVRSKRRTVRCGGALPQGRLRGLVSVACRLVDRAPQTSRFRRRPSTQRRRLKTISHRRARRDGRRRHVSPMSAVGVSHRCACATTPLSMPVCGRSARQPSHTGGSPLGARQTTRFVDANRSRRPLPPNCVRRLCPRPRVTPSSSSASRAPQRVAALMSHRSECGGQSRSEAARGVDDASLRSRREAEGGVRAGEARAPTPAETGPAPGERGGCASKSDRERRCGNAAEQRACARLGDDPENFRRRCRPRPRRPSARNA
jgi:hypothetical protein